MRDSGNRRIVVIGSGAVGSTTAYTLLLRERMNELVLIDARSDKAQGDALDMNHGIPFTRSANIWFGSYEDCRGADIIIVTAGAAQRPGESRQDLLVRNAAIFRDIITNVTHYNQEGILLIATNPVDVLSYVTWKIAGWPKERVIGSGTLLDSARLRYLIGNELGVDPRSVHAHVIGEHGDTELPVWSRANIAGVPVELTPDRQDDLFKETRDAAYQIIAAKGATYYAIALALDRICAAILGDEHSVLNVSTYVDGYLGIKDVYLGLPCVIGRWGIERTIDLAPNDEELSLLRHSADVLRDRIKMAMSSLDME